MRQKDTGTGRVMVNMVIPSLHAGGYQFKRRVRVGKRPGGAEHTVPLVASDDSGRAVLISLQWQQVPGTAEQKVPYEVLSLAHAIEKNSGRYAAAYLVLGGKGWKLRDYYTRGELSRYMKNIDSVRIVSLEDFTALANRHEL